MYNNDEIHKITRTIHRMNLHCWNMECQSRHIKFDGVEAIQTNWMQVITNDPYEWQCVAYGMVIPKNDKLFLLNGEFRPSSSYLDPSDKDGYTKISLITGVEKTTFGKTFKNIKLKTKQIVKLDFIEINTGDNMHEHANELVGKYAKFVVFD